MPAQGALVACLTGLVTLTSTRIYDLHYSTYTRVPESVSIHILRTVVLDYGELLAYWFILHIGIELATVFYRAEEYHQQYWEKFCLHGLIGFALFTGESGVYNNIVARMAGTDNVELFGLSFDGLCGASFMAGAR
jgi:hypothetical protein